MQKSSIDRAHPANAVAVGYMLAAVVGFSLIPLLIAIGGETENPFLFGASLRFGQLLGLAFFLYAFYSPLIRSHSIRMMVAQSLLVPRAPYIHVSILCVIASYFEYALFTWSTQYLDISVTAVLFELWPILMIIITAQLFRKQDRYRRVTPRAVLLLMLGLVGFAFVTASQFGYGADTSDETAFTLAIGVTLALGAALTLSLSAFGIHWGAELSHRIRETELPDQDERSLDLFCTIIAGCIGSFVGMVLHVVIGVSSGESINLRAFLVAVFFGCFILAGASAAWRNANLITRNLGVNAISYATPVLSLVWLFLFFTVNVARIDYLLIGTFAIIAANLLLNFEAELRHGFRSLIVAIWLFGTIVYVRDEILHNLGIQNWIWIGPGYFETVAAAATIFTLILSFRVGRLTSRANEEERITFFLLEQIRRFVEEGRINSQILICLMRIDAPRDPEDLEGAYSEAMEYIAGASGRDDLDNDCKERLSAVSKELNALTHSRQQGVEFGEFFALLIFAGITIFLSIFARTDVSYFTGFLIELFSIFLSSVVVFLTVNIWDLQRERGSAIFRKFRASESDKELYRVAFRDSKNRFVEQWVSIVVGFAIAVAFLVLLWNKWLGNGP